MIHLLHSIGLAMFAYAAAAAVTWIINSMDGPKVKHSRPFCLLVALAFFLITL
jgi:hypothetical protein